MLLLEILFFIYYLLTQAKLHSQYGGYAGTYLQVVSVLPGMPRSAIVGPWLVWPGCNLHIQCVERAYVIVAAPTFHAYLPLVGQ